VQVREARASDAEAIADLLEELVSGGNRQGPTDAAFVLSHYVEHPHRIRRFSAFSR
jgi:N-acetylglutamate synthase-like GNAT family acetyltransferase